MKILPSVRETLESAFPGQLMAPLCRLDIPKNKAYNIEEHNHRLAAWAASTSASASPLCRFKVHKGGAILEACGFDAAFSNPSQLPAPADLADQHLKWRAEVIAAAEKENLIFTHGIAAKLINCYLKVRFVSGGHHADARVQALHPPIDEVLLKELAAVNFGSQAKKWRKFRQARWSKFDSATYEEVIALIRSSLLPNEPLWKVEEYWKGHQ